MKWQRCSSVALGLMCLRLQGLLVSTRVLLLNTYMVFLNPAIRESLKSECPFIASPENCKPYNDDNASGSRFLLKLKKGQANCPFFDGTKPSFCAIADIAGSPILYESFPHQLDVPFFFWMESEKGFSITT